MGVGFFAVRSSNLTAQSDGSGMQTLLSDHCCTRSSELQTCIHDLPREASALEVAPVVGQKKRQEERHGASIISCTRWFANLKCQRAVPSLLLLEPWAALI